VCVCVCVFMMRSGVGKDDCVLTVADVVEEAQTPSSLSLYLEA
jgi:hypothetical protein